MSSTLTDLFIVDADSHWSEPADLFTARAPAALKDRVPHHEERDGVRVWVMDGVAIGNAGAGAVIGRDGKKAPSEIGLRQWHVEDTHAGAYDPKARVGVLDQFGIDAQIIYPSTIGLGGQGLQKVDDHDLKRATIQIYNDRQAEIQEQSGNRLLPMPLMVPRYIEYIVDPERTEAMQRIKKPALRVNPLNENTWDALARADS